MRPPVLMWAEVSAADGDHSDFDVWAEFDRKARAAGVFVDNGALQPATTVARLVGTKIAGHELPGAVENRSHATGPARIEAFSILQCGGPMRCRSAGRSRSGS